MANPETKVDSSRLEQIAKVLGIPVAVLLNQANEPLDASLVAKQEAELLQLFRAIRDAELRKRLLNLMRSAADRTVA